MLDNKYEYMVNYRFLKFYVKMGAKLTKIYEVIKFKQGYKSKDYIEINTEKEYQLKLKQKRV